MREIKLPGAGRPSPDPDLRRRAEAVVLDHRRTEMADPVHHAPDAVIIEGRPRGTQLTGEG